MRVLITSTPGTGHIHPLVPVAAALQRAGHTVLWATAQQSLPAVQRFGFETRAAGLGVPERNPRLREYAPEMLSLPPRQRRPFAFAGLFAHIAAPVMLHDLAPIAAEFRPDLIVHETAELAAAPLATQLGIPHATVAFSGWLPNDVLAQAVVAAQPLWAAVGHEVPADLGLTTHAYFHPFSTPLGEAPHGATVHRLRPGLADGAGLLDVPEWIGAAGHERPTVYATYGTEVGGVAPWPAIIAALGQLDVDAVATVGNAIPADSLGDVPPNVRVATYVPQSLLLPRAALVIAHGGSGTMLAAAAHGVPQLLIPSAADQFDNADAVMAAGVGISLEGADVNAESIAIAAGRLLVDPVVQANSKGLATMQSELPDADAAVGVLTALVG